MCLVATEFSLPCTKTVPFQARPFWSRGHFNTSSVGDVNDMDLELSLLCKLDIMSDSVLVCCSIDSDELDTVKHVQK